jgi:hypothetical protein
MSSLHERDITMLKSVLLLTVMLFLILAPEPDSNDIADMTSNLLGSDKQTALMASDIKNP